MCERIDGNPGLSPAAYVKSLREEHMHRMLRASGPRQDSDDEVTFKDPEDMTLDELREYYNKGGASRLQKMTSSEQSDLFKQYIVSVKS